MCGDALAAAAAVPAAILPHPRNGFRSRQCPRLRVPQDLERMEPPPAAHPGRLDVGVARVRRVPRSLQQADVPRVILRGFVLRVMNRFRAVIELLPHMRDDTPATRTSCAALV